MSVEAMALALHHSRAKGTARLVLVGIANHDGDGGAFPSIPTLARYAGDVDHRNVQRAIERLVELGEVVVERQAGDLRDANGRRLPDHLQTNRYRVVLRCPEDCDRTTRHRTRQATILDPVDPVAVAPPGGASATPPGGASATRTGGASATRTVRRTTRGTPALDVTPPGRRPSSTASPIPDRTEAHVEAAERGLAAARAALAKGKP